MALTVSPAMVAKLRAKPEGNGLNVVMGDFAEVPVEGQYSLIFVVFNTFFTLLTQEAQLRCFAGVAEHLTQDGRFVIGAFFPDLTLFESGQRTSTTPFGFRHDQVLLDLSLVNRAEQTVLLRASCVRRASPGLSSTSKISTGWDVMSARLCTPSPTTTGSGPRVTVAPASLMATSRSAITRSTRLAVSVGSKARPRVPTRE